MANHPTDRCTQCGQVDDHPKWHTALPVPGWQKGDPVPTQSFHHDCAPAWLVDQHPEGSSVREIVKAAQRGVHGDDLRQHIFNLHETTED